MWMDTVVAKISVFGGWDASRKHQPEDDLIKDVYTRGDEVIETLFVPDPVTGEGNILREVTHKFDGSHNFFKSTNTGRTGDTARLLGLITMWMIEDK